MMDKEETNMEIDEDITEKKKKSFSRITYGHATTETGEKEINYSTS